MVKYRNVKVKVKGGGSRIQRAMVMASGKLRFVKNLSRSRRKARHSNIKTKRRVVHLRRRRNSRRSNGHKKLTLPMAPIGGAAYGLTAPNVMGGSVVGDLAKGAYTDALRQLAATTTGFNPWNGSWNPMNAKLAIGLGVGILIHKFIGGYPLNANRALANAGVPILRI